MFLQLNCPQIVIHNLTISIIMCATLNVLSGLLIVDRSTLPPTVAKTERMLSTPSSLGNI